MKVILIIITILLFGGHSWAVQKTFGAGSLIIPMDPCWQPNNDPAVDPQFVNPAVNVNGTATWCDSNANDNAVFHAYGLVYELLQEKIPVYWIINPNKLDRNDIDFTINGGTSAPVTKLNNNSLIDPPQRTINGQVIAAHVIDYRGGPFVIDVKDLPSDPNSRVWQIINKWMTTVKIHKSNVSFTAPVDKVLNKPPPKIAVLGQGATNVLLDYLAAMGFGNRTTTVYDVLSPTDIANGLIFDYQLFWAPHWEIEKEITDPVLRAKVLSSLRTFLELGNAAFLECASIESIEGAFDVSKGANGAGNNAETQTYGGWLTDKTYTVPRIESNGGSMNYNYLVFEFPSFYLPQCSGWLFEPKGGHIHNLRPYYSKLYNYNQTVQRYIHDKDGAWNGYNPGFDYFVGGRINGSPTQGFVAYLAGHKYIQCSTSKTNTSGLTLSFKFDNNFSGKLEVEVVHTNCTQGLNCPKGYYDTSTTPPNFVNAQDSYIELKFNDTTVNGKTVNTVYVNNITANQDVKITSIIVSWTDPGIKLKVINDANAELCNPGSASSPYTCNVNVTLSPRSSTSITYCNPDWRKSNTCGIRYVLNTIFGLQFEIISNEYVISSPVIDDGIMFVGSFEFPGHKGHLRAYDLSQSPAKEIWDALNNIPDAGSGNPAFPSSNNFTRYIFTAIPSTGGMQKINFDDTQAAVLQSYLGTATLDETKALINTVRGRFGASSLNPLGSREMRYKLWGIKFSTPAVIKGSQLISGMKYRDRIVVVGADDGMLHAFYAGSWDVNKSSYTVGTGREIWAYIPSTLLSYLKNQPFNDYNRSNVVSVSGSPAVGDFFVDIDGDGIKEWRTLLVGTATIDSLNQGVIFAMDITDPYNPIVLWEKTFPTQNMGKSKGPAIGHIFKDNDVKTWVFLTTNFADKEPNQNGSYGIKAFALDILTGKIQWTFSSSYTGNAANINEVPHIPSLMDYNNDGMIDFVVFGDMQGRLWVLDAKTGKSITQGGGPIFKTYSPGNEGSEPIAGGVSIYEDWLIFGTGGANFTSDLSIYHVYALKISPNGDVLKKLTYTLNQGEKVWSAPVIDRFGNIYVGISKGYQTIGKTTPQNLQTSGRIAILSISNNKFTEKKSILTEGAQVGDIAIAEGVAVSVSFTGKVVQFGKYTGGAGVQRTLPVKIFNWKVK